MYKQSSIDALNWVAALRSYLFFTEILLWNWDLDIEYIKKI